MTEQEQPSIPIEPGERRPEDVPRVYVASLSDYNDGRLHGTWVDLDGDQEQLSTSVQQMLESSPEPDAEEWAIHDYENFGPISLGEYEDLATVHRLAAGIVEHGEAFAHWAAVLDRSEWDEMLDKFDEAYAGCWESMTEYAGQLLEDLGVDITSFGEDGLQPYISFDLEAFGRDLSFDYRISRGKGGVYVFDYC